MKDKTTQKKKKLSWTVLYLCFGAGIGLAMGILMHNLFAGLCSGVAMALCLGTAMDAADRKRSQSVSL